MSKYLAKTSPKRWKTAGASNHKKKVEQKREKKKRFGYCSEHGKLYFCGGSTGTSGIPFSCFSQVQILLLESLLRAVFKGLIMVITPLAATPATC